MKKYLLRFEPGGQLAFVSPGETVLEAARRMGYPLLASCAGRTNCGSCAVRVLEGVLAPPGKNEAHLVDTTKVRLGCRARFAESDVVLSPVVKPRTEAFAVSELGDSEYALAIDLGSTNLSLALADIKTGQLVLRAEEASSLGSYGADVLSRLSYSLESDAHASELRDASQSQILNILKTKLSDMSRLRRVDIAGNSLMAGFLVGADLSSLSQAPFSAPAHYELSEGPLKEALAAADITVYPPLAAFVGGDIRVQLATLDRRTPTMLIDIGTNIECALISEETLYLASAPAGSAFAALGAQGSELLEFIEKLIRIGALKSDGLLQEEHYRASRNQEGILEARIGDQQLDQKMIREIQLGKAALAVLVETILAQATFKPQKLLISGAFGAALNFDLLFKLAILPEELEGIAQKELLREGVLSSVLKHIFNEYPELDVSDMQLIQLAEDANFKENFLNALNF